MTLLPQQNVLLKWRSQTMLVEVTISLVTTTIITSTITDIAVTSNIVITKILVCEGF